MAGALVGVLSESRSLRIAKCRIEDGFPGFRLVIPLYSSVLHSLFRFAIDGAFFCFYRECSCGKKQANYKSLGGLNFLAFALISVFQDLMFFQVLDHFSSPQRHRPVPSTPPATSSRAKCRSTTFLPTTWHPSFKNGSPPCLNAPIIDAVLARQHPRINPFHAC
jgi:hypothetical protein